MFSCAYEKERQDRILENRKHMDALGLLTQKSILHSFKVLKAPSPVELSVIDSVKMEKKIKTAATRIIQKRCSKRLTGSAPDYLELDVDGKAVGMGRSNPEAALYDQRLVDLMERDKHHVQMDNPESQDTRDDQADMRRCASAGRGSVYDSFAGITCHFCRQKKLCGEAGCQRCSQRDVSLECIGKTQCSRCHSATGTFCRACLLIRYGAELEDVRTEMQTTGWLCPHCYEEDKPDAGWICNSSICMKRRGLAPTGIAIYVAKERGFKSVAHLLQSKLQAKKETSTKGGACEAAAPSSAQSTNSVPTNL